MVVAIIAALAGLLIPVLSRARKQAAATRTRADLQAITTALEAYRADFGDYPRVEFTTGITNTPPARPESPTGAEILCWALIGPADLAEANTGAAPPAGQHAIQDGADGPGFRVRTMFDTTTNKWVGAGRVYGPYLPADKFRLGIQGGTIPTSKLQFCILDSNGNPILYAPASPKRLSPQAAYLPATTALVTTSLNPQQTTIWDFTDVDTVNTQYFRHAGEGDSTNALKRFQILLGDYNSGTPSASTNFNGVIDTGETAATTGPFILWTAGPDGKFGTDSVAPTDRELRNCDDITNFNQ